MVGVEVAADAQLLHLDFLRAPALGCPDERMVPRSIEVVDIRRVDPELAGEVLAVEHRRLLPTGPVEPREIRERERHLPAVGAGGRRTAPLRGRRSRDRTHQQTGDDRRPQLLTYE